MTLTVPTRVGPLTVDVQGAGDQPTALLWHSLFVDSRTWLRTIPELVLDRRLIVVTGPGHGTSGDPGHRYTMEDCADAASEVLDAVGVTGQVDWVGNAWGGHVGIVFAARHPTRLRTLVTAGTPVHGYTIPSRLQTLLLTLIYRALGPAPFITDAVVEALLSERTRAGDEAAAEIVRDAFVRANRRAMTNAVISISLRRQNLLPVLPRVQVPTLFMTGTSHPDWSPGQMLAAVAHLPRGEAHVIDGPAYLVPLEAPADFTRDVRAFWAAHPADARDTTSDR